MMNYHEYLLWHLAEECAEITQRCSKIARFGMEEVQPNQPLDNRERLRRELADLFSLVRIMQKEGILPDPLFTEAEYDTKLAKVHKYLEVSRARGRVSQNLWG